MYWMLIVYCPFDRGRESSNSTLWEPTRRTHKVCFHCAVISVLSFFPRECSMTVRNSGDDAQTFSLLDFPWGNTSSMLTIEKDVDMYSLCWLQSRLPPEGGALHTRLDVYLILSPGFGHQVGFSLLQTSPLCCLLLFGELPPHLLPDYLLKHT